MEKQGRLYIGTSGWKYAHWENLFYPADLKKRDQLNYYTSLFTTVELNNSFYRSPTPENFKSWNKEVPDDFVYTVKANRFFTHLKKLNVQREDLDRFLIKSSLFEKKLGAVLFQLPPIWKINVERFASFLSLLPKGMRFVFEFRNPTWYDERIYSLLRLHNCAFCIYELDAHLSPREVTADFVYIRLHGPGEKYQGSYNKGTLKKWAKACMQWKGEGKDIFVYFDNDQLAYAPFNALMLKRMLPLQ